MGSTNGQDNEQPVHRVFVDSFELAECQVTNAEYAKFLKATNHRQPLHWNDPNFSDPQQPVVAPSWFDAAAYCEWLNKMRGHANERVSEQAASTSPRFRLPTKPSGNAPRAAARNKSNFPGVTKLRKPCLIIQRGGKQDPNVSAKPNATPTASATSAPTSTNGAPTGSAPITTKFRRNATRKAQLKEPAAAPAAAPGAITQKSPAAPPAPASPRNFNTQTTASESRAASRDRMVCYGARLDSSQKK